MYMIEIILLNQSKLSLLGVIRRIQLYTFMQTSICPSESIILSIANFSSKVSSFAK